MTRSRETPGFTLMEMLVALVLLSLVFVLLTGASQFVMGVDRRAAARTADVPRIQNFLAALISQARPALVLDREAMTGESVAFSGSPTRFEMLTSAPYAMSAGGLYDVSVSFDEPNARIELSWGVHREAAPSYDHNAILLDNVTGAEFTYYGSAEEKTGWHATWQHDLALPRLVKLRLSFADGKQAWPDMVVSPRITAHRPVALEEQ